MSGGEHRHETQEARDAAYKELAKRISRRLFESGRPAELVPMKAGIIASGLAADFLDPATGGSFDLLKINDNGTHSRIVNIDKFVDGGTVVEHKSYCSIDRGPFKRTDESMHMGGPDVPEDVHREAVARHREANLQSVKEGINGLPITAEEAQELTAMVDRGIPVARDHVRITLVGLDLPT